MKEGEVKKVVEEALNSMLNKVYDAHDFAKKVQDKLGCEYWFDEYPRRLNSVHDKFGDEREFALVDMHLEIGGDVIYCDEHEILVTMKRVWAEVFINTEKLRSGQGFYIVPLHIDEVKLEKKEE